MQPDRTDELTRLMRERILVLDGAMGTMIQQVEALRVRLPRPRRPVGCTTTATTSRATTTSLAPDESH